MHIIETHSVKRYIPADLSECDGQQYIDMSELIFNYHTGKINSYELLTHAVYKLMNMKPAESKTEEIAISKSNNVAVIEELLEQSFFERIELEDGSYQLKIVQNYIDNPVPKFRPLWQTYYGPSNAFQNVKCGEYTDALRLFLEFNQSGEMNLLYELAATLYRPKKSFHFIKKHLPSYDGDFRTKYNQHLLEKRIKAMKYAPIGFIYGVYLYFASMQIFVSGAEVPWGDKVLNLSILFSGCDAAPQIDASDIGLDSVIFAMAESGAFGDFNKMQQTPFWTMMIKMYDARVKQLQEQKIHENANNKST